ncbi:MAG: iron ABC transporter permease [Bacteroidales bacterium]|nr:iron ABC transporter permease [Bacteroidales bacterium]
MQQSGVDNIRALVRNDKKKGRWVLIISAILMVALCIVILCFDYEKWVENDIIQWINPWEAVQGIYYGVIYRVEFLIHDITGSFPGNFGSISNIVYSLPDQTGPADRLFQILLTLIAGAVLSLSGTVYQSAMRNPMAVPTMLGVSSSVNLAKMILLFYMGLDAIYTTTWQLYALSYGLSAVIILIILAAGKISGGKKVSVVDMLLAGTIINRLVQSISNYLRDQIDEATLETYQELTQRSYDYLEPISNLLILVVITLIVMTPILAMRFSYNAISFDDSDARCLGISANGMRLYAVVAGGILTVAAMVHYGDIGMLALIVPHVCRYAFGAEFRRVVVTSAFYGAFVLLVGWFLTNFMWVGDYQIPIGTILSLIALPVLIIFRFRQDHGWD